MINKWLYLITLNLIIVNTNITAQTIRGYISSNQPDSRYSVHGDGTATDIYTGLRWKVCSEGQTWSSPATCSGTATKYNWQQALGLADSANFAGFDDWRLPNIAEFRSIVAYDRYDPAINLAIFPTTQSSSYWSSTPKYGTILSDGFPLSYVSLMEFYHGEDSRQGPRNASSFYVRLVRGGRQ